MNQVLWLILSLVLIMAAARATAALRRSGEPQAGTSGVSRGRAEHSAQEAETRRPNGQPATRMLWGETGVGTGSRAVRCGGERAVDLGAESNGCIHSGVFDPGRVQPSSSEPVRPAWPIGEATLPGAPVR